MHWCVTCLLIGRFVSESANGNGVVDIDLLMHYTHTVVVVLLIMGMISIITSTDFGFCVTPYRDEMILECIDHQ